MNLTIMVAEDDPNILEVVSEYLKAAGFTVVSASDGKKAAEVIETGSAGSANVDMYILDIMLPGMNGIELLGMIRDYHADVPVIMLTALSDEHTQLHSFSKKADDYVTKPFSPKVLVKRVEALLRRCGKLRRTLEFGSVMIDIDNYEAYEDGNKVELTLKELEILKALIDRRNRVLSRQQLMDIVWGNDYFGDERTVDAHIKNLRKKFSREIIRTVKGVGYRINSD